MNRREAATAGERFFNAAAPCKRDGSLQRYTANGVCCLCCKARARKDYAEFRDLLKTARHQTSG